MKKSLGIGLPIFLVLCAASDAQAQQQFATTFEPAALVAPAMANAATIVQDPQEQRPEEQMSTSGFFLGIIGMVGGAAFGSQIGQGKCPPRREDKDCMGRYAYTGALIAGTISVPLGVHLANKSRRNLPLALAASTATALGLYYGMKAIPGEPIAMAPFLAAPIQVVTSVKLESRQ